MDDDRASIGKEEMAYVSKGWTVVVVPLRETAVDDDDDDDTVGVPSANPQLNSSSANRVANACSITFKLTSGLDPGVTCKKYSNSVASAWGAEAPAGREV